MDCGTIKSVEPPGQGHGATGEEGERERESERANKFHMIDPAYLCLPLAH